MNELLPGYSGIPNSSTKHELRSFARGEFERHKNVTDVVCQKVHDVSSVWYINMFVTSK